jgi:cytochrome b involved in lipid metabolism
VKQYSGLILIFLCGFSKNGLALSKFTLKDLVLHNKPSDCWMAIEGSVYNVTPAVKDHLRNEEFPLDAWCGKEATQAWKTKGDRNKPHSRKANLMLKNFLIGTLVP